MDLRTYEDKEHSSGKPLRYLYLLVQRRSLDPKAFVIVSDIREVMGEGFIEIKQ